MAQGEFILKCSALTQHKYRNTEEFALDCNMNALKKLDCMRPMWLRTLKRSQPSLQQLGHQCLRSEHFRIILQDIGEDIQARKMSLDCNVDVSQKHDCMRPMWLRSLKWSQPSLQQLGHQCLRAEHFRTILPEIGKDIQARKMSLDCNVDASQASEATLFIFCSTLFNGSKYPLFVYFHLRSQSTSHPLLEAEV